MTKIRARKTTHPGNNETGYRINGRIWVEKDGKLYLGWGRIILLERIEELGSISAAARSMKLGYGNAWLWIDSMNRLAKKPLVEKLAGGTKGGYSRLTAEGRKVIIQYKELREKFLEFISQVS
ncbi:MAG: LysR family transcriptional regulator [Actinobacteria bacterium]|nr:LysR family transcriptional regulator [Actinomycetota bacterium]